MFKSLCQKIRDDTKMGVMVKCPLKNITFVLSVCFSYYITSPGECTNIRRYSDSYTCCEIRFTNVLDIKIEPFNSKVKRIKIM